MKMKLSEIMIPESFEISKPNTSKYVICKV